MGAQNVTAVIQKWAHLDHRPIRLLICMALTAKDKDNPPVYYGGREMSAGFLGYTLESPQAQRTAFRAVQKVIDQLIAEGALARETGPSKRSNARYLINLDGPANGWSSRPSVRSEDRWPSGPPEQLGTGGPEGTQQVVLRAPTGGPEGTNRWPSGGPIGREGTNLKDEIEDYPAPEVTRSPMRGRTASGDGDVLIAEIVEETGYDLGPMSPELASLFAPPASKAPETAQCSNCIREVDLWAIDRYQGRPVCISCKETLTGGEPW